MLGKTKGVPLFQEQAMKIAHGGGEFHARRAQRAAQGDGDLPRAAPSAARGEDGRRMVERGYDRSFAERCFDQIKGFGEYGFPESHARAFAHLVYCLGWIKCRYPAAFAAACSIRSRWDSTRRPRSCAMRASMGWRSASRCQPQRLRRDPHRLGAQAGAAARPALGDGLKEADARLVATRRGDKPYGSLPELRQRTSIAVHSIETLAAAMPSGRSASTGGRRCGRPRPCHEHGRCRCSRPKGSTGKVMKKR
jgi:error-prone DNA polymerase